MIRPRLIRFSAAGSLFSLFLAASPPPAQVPPGPPPEGRRHGPPPENRRSPPDRPVRVGPPGRWWTDERLAQLLQLTTDQQKSMDHVFERDQPKLIKLNDTLKREEAVLRPLVAADIVDEAKLFPQIDRTAEARAELEKANARMLIELRRILTAEQWHQLQADDPEVRFRRPPPPRGSFRP